MINLTKKELRKLVLILYYYRDDATTNINGFPGLIGKEREEVTTIINKLDVKRW